MIFRAVCVTLAVAFGATAVLAQSAAITERKAIMKGVGARGQDGRRFREGLDAL